MDPKLQKFISILMLFLIAKAFLQATHDWLVLDIAMDMNPVFQTGLLYCIAGFLLNQESDARRSQRSQADMQKELK